MTKLNFLFELREKLKGLPQNEIDERLNFYSEMIEDMVEEGFSEEEAVKKIGSVKDISEQIISEIPLSKIAKERIKPKRKIKPWETTLIVVGSPIWISLLVVFFSVIFALFVSLWSVIISLWATFVSFIVCGFAAVFVGIAFCFMQKGVLGLAMIGVGLICLGFGILMFLASHYATKGTVLLTKKTVLGIKKCFIKREEA